MGNLLLWIGRVAGLLGVVICAASFTARVAQMWTLGGFPVGTLFQAGIAAMVLGCLAYSADLAERARK
jgi:hypothetical protein